MPLSVIKLITLLIKTLSKPVGVFLIWLKGKKDGQLEAEKEALEEHAKTVDKATAGRIIGERDGLRDEDYRD